MMINFKITQDNLHIEDSYKVIYDVTMRDILNICKAQKPDSNVFKRSDYSLLSEWRAHNLLYNLNIKRDETKDVDLDSNETILRRIQYTILGTIYYLTHF